MTKKELSIILCLLVAAVLVPILILKTGKPAKSAQREVASIPDSQSQPNQTHEALEHLTKQLNQKYGADFYRTFFRDKILANAAVSRLYAYSKRLLPGGGTDELMRMYIAEGLNRWDSEEFSTFMTQLMAEMNEHSAQIAAEILARDADLKKDPFVYQMTLNMVAALNLPTAQKAEIMGKAFEVPFATDSSGQMTAMSANITNAFILMKNSGVSPSEASSVIQIGQRANQGNPAGLSEFIARVHTYYPGVIQ